MEEGRGRTKGRERETGGTVGRRGENIERKRYREEEKRGEGRETGKMWLRYGEIEGTGKAR